MRAVIIQHEEHEGPGTLGPALTSRGFTLVHRFRGVKREDLDAELVVVMGGAMGVYEQDVHPFLATELAFLTERLALGGKVLGVCLGAQLLARAAGAEVFPGKNGFEVGVAPVRLTRDGEADPVFGPSPGKLQVAHWHGDTFSPVPGATLLASTDRYTQQAFRVGGSYGMQFHVELTHEVLGEWLRHGAAELAARGKDLDELLAQLPRLKSAEPALRALVDRLVAELA